MTDTPPRKRPPPPDLQRLVEMFGSYAAITPEAWRKYDRDCERYRAAMRARDFWRDE